MRATLQPSVQKAHWARKYSQEIAIGFFFLALLFIGIAIYWAFSQTPTTSTGVTIQSPAAPLASSPPKHDRTLPTPEVSQTPQPILYPLLVPEATPAPRRIIAQPVVSEVPVLSSTFAYADGIKATVTRIRTINGFTAVTFKVDGSGNSRSDLFVVQVKGGSDDFRTEHTYLIDNNGRRYHLVNEKPEVPEQIPSYDNNGFYMLAPHEVVFVTYLFDKVDDSARNLEVHFSNFVWDMGKVDGIPPIRVVLQ